MEEDTFRFYEMMDSCRPGRGDEGLPEMAPLAEQLERDPQLRQRFEESQELDRSIQAALQRVPVPAGLAERVLEAVEDVEPTTDENVTTRPSTGDGPTAPRDSRRSLIWKAGIPIAIAASAVVAFVMLGRTPEQDLPTAKSVAARAMHWTSLLDNANWLPAGSQPSGKLPLKAGRWQRVAAGASSVVCYDLTGTQESPIYLFVIKSTQKFPGSPPAVPDRSTQGWCFGVWSEAGAIYVVAVEGVPKRYKSIIRMALPKHA